MNKFQRPGSLTLPALLLLIAFSTLILSGCGNGAGSPGGPPPYNEDSVKGHVISLADAVLFTKEFRRTVDTFNHKCPGFKDSMQLGHSETFNKDSYNLLLSQKDSAGNLAAGIRIYYGVKDGQFKLILVPVDSSGRNILHHLISLDVKTPPGATTTESLTVDGAQVLEQGQRCPPVCPPPGPLDPQ